MAKENQKCINVNKQQKATALEVQVFDLFCFCFFVVFFLPQLEF